MAEQRRFFIYADPNALGGYAIQDEETALNAVRPQNLAAVWEIISTISWALNPLNRPPTAVDPTPTWRVERNGAHQPDHPIGALLLAPSEIVNPAKFWTHALLRYLSLGNQALEIVRNPLGADRLMPVLINQEQSTVDVYRVTNDLFLNSNRVDESDREVSRSRIINLTFPGLYADQGLNPVRSYAKTGADLLIDGSAMQTARFRAARLRSTVFLVDPAVAKIADTDKALEKLMAEIKASTDKAEEAGRSPVLPPGITAQTPPNVTDVDAAVANLLDFAIADIARAYSYPLEMVGLSRLTRPRPYREVRSQYFTQCLRPHAANLSAELSFRLFSQDEYRQGYRVVIDVEDAQFGTQQDRLDLYGGGYAQHGIFTLNEARAGLGKQPRPDGDTVVNPRGTGGPSNANDTDEEDPATDTEPNEEETDPDTDT